MHNCKKENNIKKAVREILTAFLFCTDLMSNSTESFDLKEKSREYGDFINLKLEKSPFFFFIFVDPKK